MTPEERAQDIFDRIVRIGKYRNAGVAYDPIPFIADHIRQARAEALEEAIRKCKAIKPVINSTHGHGVSDAIDVLSALKQQPQERE